MANVTQRDPIAIIGIGCRFPGHANNPDAFWELLVNRGDAVMEIPAERWNIGAFFDRDSARPGRMRTRRGGFVDGVTEFDAAFFGITPREAAHMDPQQRMFLETTWQALQDAGIVPEELTGSKTAVYVGVSGHDYGIMQLNPSNRYLIGGHTMMGVTNCMVANRVSYLLDLRGPSMVVDTACSSSLVAAHLACRSLQAGDATLAIVGGVSALLNPEATIGFSQGTFLSPDGRCKAFDKSGDGYVRSEGSGTVILKPLSRALEDGDHVYALIRGSATNQDGRTNGITVPSREAQRDMIIDACRDADIAPGQIGFVEAHGTGTSVGDPIEAAALAEALSIGRNGEKCVVGAVKTNVGHLESAAGVAGLIKTALVLERGVIPPNIHFTSLNPDIDLSASPLELATETRDWPGDDAKFASVNSFGFGGANAHLVLEGTPATARSPRRVQRSSASERSTLFCLSAKTPRALSAYAEEYAKFLAGGEGTLSDIAASQATTRSHFDQRLAIPARTREQLRESLLQYATGTMPSELCVGVRDAALCAGPIVFVCSGQGPQWWGMARDLLKSNRVFAEAVERVHAELEKYADWSLLAELAKDESSSRISETAIAQPALFAVQIGLAAVWQDWGYVPGAVIGHSIGEVAAAHICGALTFEQAVQVIFHRSRVQQKASGKGKMLAVGLTPEEAEQRIAAYRSRACVAAINGPQTVALAGDTDALEEIAAELSSERIFCRMLQVNVAFHSHHMDPLEEELKDALSDLKPGVPRLPMYSTVTGEPIPAGELDADYWWRNVREPVRFAPTIKRLIVDSHRIFLELGPHPIHSTAIGELLSQAGEKGLTVSSLRRQQPDIETLMASVGTFYAHGLAPRWSALYPDSDERIKVPHYPWQREKYWLESDSSRQKRSPSTGHPLVGEPVGSPDIRGRHVWQFVLDPLNYRWLEDHRVQGLVVFPGAAHIDMMLGCIQSLFGRSENAIENVEFRRPLFVFDDKPPPQVQVVLSADRSISVFSRHAGEDDWTLHATATLGAPVAPWRLVESMNDLKSRCSAGFVPARLYERQRDSGLALGPTFRSISELWHGQGKSFGIVETPAALLDEAPRYGIHPALLDSAFQTAVVSKIREGEDDKRSLYLPVQVGRMSLFEKPAGRLFCYGEAVLDSDPEYFEGEFWIMNEDLSPVAHLEGFRGKSITRRSDESDAVMNWLYEFRWRPEALLSRTRLPASFIPAGAVLEDATADLLQEFKDSQVNPSYHLAVEAKMDRLSVAYVTAAFRELGFRFSPGRRFTLAQLAAELGVQDKHAQYLGFLAGLLVRHGILAQSGNEWSVVAAPVSLDADGLLAELRRDHPEFEIEYVTHERCGKGQAAVLRGSMNAVELIFAESASKSMADLYGKSIAFSKINRLARQVVEACVAHLPKDRPLRILELGAGTGGTTEHMLPILPQGRVEYVFTDVTQVFLAKARQRFSEYDFVEYRILDIEQDIANQGFDVHYFDFVIASNVLHATRDLASTLANVRRLMTSQGLLVVIESTSVPHWVDLTFGLTEGWWRFQDRDLRPDYPLLSRRQWIDFLTTVGFNDVHGISDTIGPQERGNAVLLARAPSLDLTPWQPRVERGPWVVLADSSGLAEKFIQMLGEDAAGSVVVMRGSAYRERTTGYFEVDPTDHAQIKRVLEQVRSASGSCSGVLHLWNLDFGDAEVDSDQLLAAERDGAYSVIALAQALGEIEWPVLPRLWIATRGSQPVTTADTPCPPQNPVWGIARVLLSERTELRIKTIDLATDASPQQDARQLYDEYLLARRLEHEVAFRDGARHVHRLQHQSAVELDATAAAAARVGEHAFTLLLSNERALDQLHYTAVEKAAVGADEIEIRVAAAALNFRDLMLALGLLSEGATSGGLYGESVGVECAGVVTRVGAAVTNLRPGDRVVAFAGGCFGSYVKTRAVYAVKIPRGLREIEAATLPMAYLTAYYALTAAGRLRKGESVLIHAAAGGVGLAAVHIAKALGATIYATAGSDEKRGYLKSLGVEHVFDSRSLSFADEVRAASGAGVDVVLNSLQGDYIVKSLALLKPGGRFLEIGKKDIYEDYKLGLRPFGRNLTYAAIDIDRLLLESPEECRRLLSEVIEKISSEALPVLPRTEFGAARIADAFRFMAAAKQIGKIVVTYGDEEIVSAYPVPKQGDLFRSDASYLVTGGLSGFGLRTAQWLVENGARTVVLAGRRGQIDDENRGPIASMQARGATVVVERADVSRAEDVAALLSRLESRPPLRGVFHCAMVLDDGMLATMTVDKFLRVVQPKIDGVWHLHRQTLALPIDYFVMYSSMTWVVGTPGQANYAAANGFLEALARYRRRQGLHGLTINWGAIGEVGFVARNSLDSLSRLGWLTISPDNALKLVAHCLAHHVTTTSVFGVSWSKMSKKMSMVLSSSSLSHLVVEDDEAGAGEHAQGQDLRAELSSLAANDRPARLVAALSAQVARVFDMSAERLDPTVALTDLGMDSLMAGQVRNWIAKRLEIDFPIMGLMRGPTVAQLAAEILGQLFGTAVTTVTAGPTAPAMPGKSKFSVDQWFYRPKPKSETASLRIFGLPFVGGGASVFTSWADNLSEAVEVVGIQYPGRETRLQEPPIDRMPEIIESLGEAMLTYLDRSFVLYGHSMGGLLTFELAKYLQEKYSEVPAKIIIGGWLSPALVHSYVRGLNAVQDGIDVDSYSDDHVIEILHSNRLFDEEDGVDRAFISSIMKSVRADLRMLGDYRFDPSVKLRCPITVIGGQSDPLFTMEQLGAWEALTTQSFSLRTVPGPHLFIRRPSRELFAVLGEELSTGSFPSFVQMFQPAAQ